MLKRKIILPNQVQQRTNSVPTPYLLRKIEICTFADDEKGVPDPPPPGLRSRFGSPTPKTNLIPILVMARSKIGGAFGMLRGSIGSVTYSTKKTSSGKTEQIARQKAQSVTNPNTTSQILQRMKLGPAQRFYDAFENVVAKGILSHAFEAIPYGNASRQHFISLAMKEEAAVYVPKGVDFFVPGEYVVSEGSLTSLDYHHEITADDEQSLNSIFADFRENAHLTADDIEKWVALGYEKGMQLTVIGARAIAGGRYEPFASRILMSEGNFADNPLPIALCDGGVFIDDDTSIAAVAFIVSKGSQESNDYRSTQKMMFVNGYNSLKSLDALQAAIESYQEGYEVNSLNSNWYLNQDNGQAFNGRVELLAIQRYLNNDTSEEETTGQAFIGVQVNGSDLTYVVFTSDGTANGKIYNSAGGSRTLTNPRASDVTAEGNYILGVGVALSPKSYKQLTPEIAAQGGFTLGAA